MTAQKIELGEVCRQDRRSATTADAILDGLEFVGMEHVDPETGSIATGSGSRTGEGKGTAFLFDSRHVLFGKLRPYLRKIALPDAKGCSSTELVPLLPDVSKLDRKYLFHWLRQPWVTDLLMAKHTGARMPRADMDVLLSLKISLPRLEEQKRLVDLLDRAALIRRRAAIARMKAHQISEALFIDTFGDPVSNPLGWPKIMLGDAILEGPQNGLYRPATDYGSGTRILRIDSFDDGVVVDQRELKRVNIDDMSIEKFCLLEGDIVINRVNSPPQLGKATMVPYLEEPVVFESNMMRLRVDPNILLPAVVGTMLQLRSVRSALTKNAKHAINQSSINQGDVAGVKIFAPPMPLQLVFSERIRRVGLVSHHLDHVAAKADEVASGLSSEVFG
jgi:type I restriction enzyme, S subunit